MRYLLLGDAVAINSRIALNHKLAMPKYDFRLTAIIQTLDNDTHLAEALFFPEVSRYGSDLSQLREALKKNAVKIIEDSSPLSLHTRRGAGVPEIGSISITIEPPPKSVAWRNPVHLEFDLLRWQQGEDACIAYIPSLGIEVVARDSDELEAMLPAQIRAHLLRTAQTSSLGKLVRLQRSRMILLDQSSFFANVRTPKQIAAQWEEDEESKKSVLEEVATDLTSGSLPEAFEMEDTIERIAESLAGGNPRSVLLVGPSGAGKTAAVYEMVRRRKDLQMGRAPFWATSGSRLVAGMSGFGMWQERCGKLWREASSLKAVIHFGNLLELMEVGKSVSDSQGIAGFFRPYISRGDLLAIVECTTEQLPVIERDDPQLLDAFFQIKVEQPSAEKGKIILMSYVIAESRRRDPAIDMEGIEMVDRLHRRYAAYSASPGRPIRFLKNLLQDREPDKTLSASDVTDAFSKETGLPLFLLNASVKLDLPQTSEWFEERVIGQPEAVGLIVDLLATVKAGLARPGKPIASLLFIGPTGVGKTEMARSLAEFLFSHKDRMIRFDMSEYSNPAAVGRLIGGTWQAEGLLTSKVREQPFSVILLDEVEKADPSFFDLLLQVLGEGRLTDSAGRVADFTNAVVIMTSNLGAETFRRSSLGFGAESDLAARAREHFLKEVRAFVRPEFFNRIDRIVPFAPLDRETVLRIAEREIRRLRDRDGILYSAVSLNVSEEVTEYLARKGYDARYGARPLKRAIERELLVPFAECLNRQTADVSLLAEARMEGGDLTVSAQVRKDEAGRQVSAMVSDSSLGEIANRVVKLRRDLQMLERCPAVAELRNDIFRLDRLEKRLARKTWKRIEDMERLKRLPDLKKGLESLKEIMERVCSLEEEMMLALYGKAHADKERLARGTLDVSKEWNDILLTIYGLQFDRPDYVTVAVYSENLEWLFNLSRAYYEIADESGANIEVFKFTSDYRKSDHLKEEDIIALLGREVIKERVNKPEEFVAEARQGIVGIAMGIRASLAFPKYEPERGLHMFAQERQTHKCLVHTSEAPASDYKRPEGMERRGAIGLQDRRRSFDFEEMMAEDAALKKRFTWRHYNLVEVMSEAIEQRLIADATAMPGDSSDDS